MFTNIQFRDFAVAKAGYKYEVGPTRTTGTQGYFDCSGLVTYAAHNCGMNIPTVSWLQAQWCRDSGTLIDPSQPNATSAIEKALNIPGCLLFHGQDFAYQGYASGGHVAITMGDGANIIEAKGHAWGVLVDSALPQLHSSWWDNCAYLPGITYSGKVNGGHVAPVPEGNPMYASNQICDEYDDGKGHIWGLTPNGGVLTLQGTEFYGSYGSLVQPNGEPYQARTDFGHISARWDGTPGYTIIPITFTHPMQRYDFGPDHPGTHKRALQHLKDFIDSL